MGLSGESSKKNAGRILKKSKFVILGLMAFVMILTGVLAGIACSSEGKVKATWVQAQVAEDTVSISESAVNNNKIVHFNVSVEGGTKAFMAYDLNGEIIVRANVCPPCRSVGFSLDGDELVCDTCETTFKTNTGQGIQGYCKDFPKDSVSYQTTGGNLIMQNDDLMAAYQSTNEKF